MMSWSRTFNGSLKVKLILPFVLLILLLTLVIGWLSWWASSRTVANLSDQLMLEMTQRISQAVDRHMFGTGAVLETAFPEGMYAPIDISADIPAMTTRFYTAATIFTDPSDYVYYGNELGQGFGLQKLVDGTAQIRMKLRAEDKRSFYLLHNINAKPEYRFTEGTLFDPRGRVWYQLGRDAPQHTWTAVYLDFGTRELVVTRARKVINEQGVFAGVVATDLFLSELSRFIQQLPVTANSRAFIVEPSGELIAASSVANVRTNKEGVVERVNAQNSGDSVIEQAWAQLDTLLQQADEYTDEHVHQLSFTDNNGEQLHLSVRNIRDDAGLNWYAVIAVPSSDILADVRANALLVVNIGVVALLIAVGLGLMVFGRIARDISKLSEAVRSTGRDLTDVSDQAKRDDEIGVLARSFNEMRSELFTDRLTGAANRMALDYNVDTLLLERKADQRPFALLFLDLNKFKPLNDTYGHDKGDQALIEIAQRIKSVMPDTGVVARFGGDEYVVLIREATDLSAIHDIIERLHEVIRLPLEFCDGFSLGAAIGMAVYPEHGQDRTSLLKYADQEMYNEKQRTHAVR